MNSEELAKLSQESYRSEWTHNPGITTTFEKGLENLINTYSKENGSDTPDFILSGYLIDCLEAWNRATKWREKWYGRAPEPVDSPTDADF